MAYFGSLSADVEKMVGMAGRMDLPTGLPAGFGQRDNEPFPVLVIPENRLAPIATIHHMIDGSEVLHSAQIGGAHISQLDSKFQPIMISGRFIASKVAAFGWGLFKNSN